MLVALDAWENIPTGGGTKNLEILKAEAMALYTTRVQKIMEPIEACIRDTIIFGRDTACVGNYDVELLDIIQKELAAAGYTFRTDVEEDTIYIKLMT